MGFRSSIITDCYNIKWPIWFYKKYKNFFFFRKNRIGSIASRFELKHYTNGIEDLPTDIQKVLSEVGFEIPFALIYLHENSEATRCVITAESIAFDMVREWFPVKHIIWG